ncbi:hypothetical protein A3A79_02540 [Candidatus Gottesmanbacteria bacterium RIFCSPLOWO2_01_FULL_43_11b]|uniref:Elp3/MiaA/NifB-like radical SAM core domain-containing protein n=1 Tax=Candidatus Gottesmanbacteria bacterium RIFCSPLOWO2_01_FULL_43_11b TaxID=1798392 RepID=A0A1F6AH14_9BACT|nr:MAG: hypothetical protein A3A79_02540 [Candidatus Gottesmanbacteria bacterium RIFCSPLOWO2_01_FULL_43_11b]
MMKSPNKESISFVQFSDKLLTPDSIMRDYYRKTYSKMDGYYFPEHYMEIPFWIPTIAGVLPSDRYEKSLHIIEDLDASVSLLTQTPQSERILFSVMDANVQQVHHLAQSVDRNMILGGYTDPADFSGYRHVRYLNGLGKLTEVLEVQLDSPPDYTLFRGEKCIPRLMLSDGCLFVCSFCTVPTTLTIASPGKIKEQVEALKPLDFKLIFINDKSFGQAKNWHAIREVSEQVQQYNQDFLGFIVQTPPSLALKDGLMEEAVGLGVKYMEFGVETVNDQHLALLNKPYRVKHLEEVCERARRLGLKIIPNFILGIPGDDYKATIEWVIRNRDIIPVVNINFLAIHYGNERGKLPWEAQTVGDRDQNVAEKSWLSQDDLARMKEAMETIYEITVGSNS